MNPASSPARPAGSPRRPQRKIIYWFLFVLATMGLVPLGLAAYKLIGLSRESLVTAQQEVQLQMAAAAARQLDASVQSVQTQLARLAGALESGAGRAAAGAPRAAPDGGFLERLLGEDFLLLRHATRGGASAEARVPGFPTGAVEAVVRQTGRDALDGRAVVGDPVVLRTAGGPRTVLVIGVPVGDGKPAPAALTGVADFAPIWQAIARGRRAGYLIYALDGQGRLFAAQDEERVLERVDPASFGIVQDFLGVGGHSALTSEFTVQTGGTPTPRSTRWCRRRSCGPAWRSVWPCCWPGCPPPW
jgi:hypothetical protein